MARVAVQSATLALLRGDRAGAAFIAKDTADPVTTLVAAAAVAHVLRLYSLEPGVGARQVQQIVVDELQQLAAINPSA